MTESDVSHLFVIGWLVAAAHWHLVRIVFEHNRLRPAGLFTMLFAMNMNLYSVMNFRLLQRPLAAILS